MKTYRTHSDLLYFIFIVFVSGILPAGGFNFDSGTVQDWTLTGAYVDGSGPYTHSFGFGWKDPVNYPGIPGADPAGNGLGSIQMFTFGGHGITQPGTWWIMQFHSPDVSSDPDWQNAYGYTVKLAECMVSLGTLYANLYVRVYDHDQAKDRYFYNGEAQPLTHCIYGSQDIWNSLTFDWSKIASFPANYTIKEVFINIMGTIGGAAYEGGVYLDQVQPFGPPAAPTNLQTSLISPQIHLTWDDNASNENGYKIQYKRWNRFSFEPADWTDTATLGPDSRSYQHNSATYNYYYKFRVCAFNDNGESVYSNESSLLVGILLYWINIISPNGGEKLAAGANREITWSTSNGIVTVTIDYSIDGGSNWVSPPIVTGTFNDGSHTWTVPDTLSSNCLIRIRDAAFGPYDLSNQPFSIVPAAPDLVVRSVTISPEKPVLGQPYTATVVLKNQGSQNASGFYVDWFPYRDSPPAPGTYSTRYQWVSTVIAPGALHTVTFTDTYYQSSDFTAYALLDTDKRVTEADEDNNVSSPLAVSVNEFEFKQETQNASGWFGGDDSTVRNIGYGQSFTLPRSAHADYAGFRLFQSFDYPYNPSGTGHAATLVLNVRAANGIILKTITKDLPALFNGGWVLFDLDMDLWGKQTYIFTCYLRDGHSNQLFSRMAGRTDDPWPDSQGYRVTVTETPYDMEDWSLWETHTWDFNFRIAGRYTDLSNADFNQDHIVWMEDLWFWADAWLNGNCILPNWCDRTDVDHNGIVNLSDFQSLASAWLWLGYGWLDRGRILAYEYDVSPAPVFGDNLYPGSYVIYFTNLNRWGKFIVEKLNTATNTMTIGWTTYNSDGSVYKMGTGLEITASTRCDLDDGVLNDNDKADCYWLQTNPTTQYLYPTNASLFKLMYRAPAP